MASLSPLMEEVLALGKSVEITVTGNSMYPMLKHRVSRVRLAPAGELRAGDIPLYRRDNGKFVLHRIVSLEGETFTCCGDNQWVLEPGLRPDQVLGVMTHYAREGEDWKPCGGPLYTAYRTGWVTARPLRRLVIGGLRRVRRALG